MQAIVDFFSDIGHFFQSILHFITTLFDGLFWLVGEFPNVMVTVLDLVAYCPEFIRIFLLCSVSIIMIFAVFKLL